MKNRLFIYKRLIKGSLSGAKNLIFRSLKSTSLRPEWLWFEVTDRCNSRCTAHCNIWSKKPTENPLSPQEVQGVFSDPIFSDVKHIIISGGEPVLRPDIVELYLAINKALPNAAAPVLSTNGIASERIIKVVKELISRPDIPLPLKIGISLDGIGQKHDLIRGTPGNFENVNKLLEELVAIRKRSKKVSPMIGFTLSDMTVDNFEEVREYARKMDVGLVVQWFNTSSYYDNIGKSSAEKEENIIVKEKMMKILKSPSTYPSPLNDMWINWLSGGSIRFKCFAMYKFCVLRCNGDIAPCLTHWDIKAGNVREKTPTEIWHSYEADQARKIVKNCKGCLNSWSVGWSFFCSFFPQLWFNLRHKDLLFKKITGKFYKRQCG